MNSASSSFTQGKTLFIRLDRIGDLILSLPVDESFSEGDWWISRGLGFITRASSPKRNAQEMDKKFSAKKFFELLKTVRRARYDRAIVFHGPWWVGLLLWLARVPVRVGVKSQWHSFLFFTHAVRQKRSRAEHSELEYNYRLVEEAFGLSNDTLKRTSLKLVAVGSTDQNQSAAIRDLPKEYVVVHAGMAGSARNWPTENYQQLIEELLAENTSVVMTGTTSDEPYLSPLRDALGVSRTGLIWLDGKLGGSELIGVLARAKSIVAPSTGVIHLAASTSRKTIGLYSPVRVQKPRRWGPQGQNVKTFEPAVECPGEMRCLGETCPKFDCMKMITVSEVLNTIRN